MTVRGALALVATVGVAAGSLVAQDTPETGGAIQPGFGRLNQDLITLQLHQGPLDIRITPLDARVLVLLSPGAETALQAMIDSRRDALDSLLRREGIQEGGLVLATFFARENNVGFDPNLLTVALRNRLIRPVGTLALSPAFSGQVLDTRGQAMGLILFREPIPVTEPFEVEYRGTRNADWERRLTRFDRERSRIRAIPGATAPSGDP